MGENNFNSANFRLNFKRAFNNAVGCGKDFSRQEIVDILGVTMSTVENWGNYEAPNIPKAEHFERLKYILPPFYKKQIEDFYLETENVKVCGHSAMLKISEFQTEIIRVFEDNIIDRDEKKVLLKQIPAVQDLLERLYKHCKK